MKKLAVFLLAIGSLLSGCVAYETPYQDRDGYHEDRDRERTHDRMEREHEHEHEREHDR